MEYSTKKPTKEGWYWAWHSRRTKDEIVEITNHSGVLCLEESDGRIPLSEDTYYTAFAGPLVPPI
jgi:hypothetical protein